MAKINLWIPDMFLGMLSPKKDDNDSKEKNSVSPYKNEFTELLHEFVNDVALFRDKYPITTLITMVAFTLLGISSFFSFSFTGLISCTLYCTTATCLAKSIGEKGAHFWAGIRNSLFELFQAQPRKVPITVTVEK